MPVDERLITRHRDRIHDVPSLQLFHEVCFHIVISDKLSSDFAAELSATLKKYGATEAVQYPRNASVPSIIPVNILDVTHIVSADVDFSWYSRAEEFLIPVVTADWVKLSLEKNKIAQIRPFSPDPKLMFRGVFATCADLPPGDKEAICGGILAMGGQFSNHLNKFITHVVALDMQNDKCQQVAAKKLSAKLVLPHWFDDCLKLGRRIKEDPYMLPDPPIEKEAVTEPIPFPLDVDLTHSYPPRSSHTCDPPDPPVPQTLVFNDKCVKLCDDLCLGVRLRAVIGQVIEKAQGKMTDDVRYADVLVCQFRDGDDYIKASRRGIAVGNLTWIYWMLTHGEWASPLKRLLHYPVSREGLMGMKDYLMTVSNYGGDARLYLEHLVAAAGARFTKSMKSENTHLITARSQSEKCMAAREWNIHMVNHLWLEESYAKWEVQSLTNPRYLHFPPRTNLMEVVGQTPIDPKALEQFYGPDQDTGSASESEIEQITQAWSQDAPLQFHRTPNTMIQKTSQKKMPLITLARTTQNSSLSSTVRKAKEAAVAKLHDEIMPDVALFEKEQKRKGGVLGGGRRRTSGGSLVALKPGRKRTVSLSDDDEANINGQKRPKPMVMLLITGYKAWIGHPDKEDREKVFVSCVFVLETYTWQKTLQSLGIECVDVPSQCTHLAAPSIVRTEKFCCALANAPVIVSINWVEACIRKKAVLDLTSDTYQLDDPEGENRLGINLASSLNLAKQNAGTLLRGQAIFCTPGVHGGIETCRRIVEANGGVVIPWTRGGKSANARPNESSEIFVLLSSEKEEKQWLSFTTMCKKKGKEVKIYRADWLLDAAMQQRIRWDDAYRIK